MTAFDPKRLSRAHAESRHPLYKADVFYLSMFLVRLRRLRSSSDIQRERKQLTKIVNLFYVQRSKQQWNDDH
jgi:hypothetical protein